MVEIHFQDGTLLLSGSEPELSACERWLVYDERVALWRAEAYTYAHIVTALHVAGVRYHDKAREYEPLHLVMREIVSPRDYQLEAVSAWEKALRRGVIVLPTGTGKSLVARLAIDAVQRPTLVVVPTIDLLQQWASQLEEGFGVEAGMLGGGSREVKDITVSTYDSAVLMMEFIGNRFGFLIVDECHHLPSSLNRHLARMAIAPFRLGLTATPERDDGGEDELTELLGPICYRKHIDEMPENVLSPYRTVRLELSLEPDEEIEYEKNRAVYVDFVKQNRISFASPSGWQHFLALCARQPRGREVFDAYLAQKRIARGSRAKFRMIRRLLARHPGERTIIFTDDNQTAYEVGRRFFLPVLTHRTKVAERKAFLTLFRDGTYPVLVTSRVLNEGIDVPEASVGIVVSGSGSIREHVQRLGRVLRPVDGKQATLYELVSSRTSEAYTSDRRRQHRAYQRPN